jgi:hypothetical protein
MICSGLCLFRFIMSLLAQFLGSRNSQNDWIKFRGAGQTTLKKGKSPASPASPEPDGYVCSCGPSQGHDGVRHQGSAIPARRDSGPMEAMCKNLTPRLQRTGMKMRCRPTPPV